jgi:aminoacylase
MTLLSHEKEMISFLQKYIQINTAQPCPNYNDVCTLFTQQAEQDNLECIIITLSNGKPVIIVSLYGSDKSLPSLILNHHMDVVPALNSEKWIAAPFDGATHNNMIIGRGTQDAKGLGVLHYYALKALKKENAPLARSIHLTIVPDEEIGGFSGTKLFIETDFFRSLNAQFILDEGIASGKENTFLLKIGERKPLQIKITTQGTLAHGSKLNCFNVCHELVTLLNEFTQLHHQQQQKSNLTAPGLLLSTNITSLTSGVHHHNETALNIIPDCATATIDIRIPPTMTTQEAINIVENIVRRYPHSSYTILAVVTDYQQSHSSETPLYHALAQSIIECGLTPKPFYFEASSDLRFYIMKGLDGVGFSPFTTPDNLHGTNESVSIADLIQAKKSFVHFLKNFCG